MYILLQGQEQYFSITIYLFLWRKSEFHFCGKRRQLVYQVYIRPKSKIQYCSWCKEEKIVWGQPVMWSSALLLHRSSRDCRPQLSVWPLSYHTACSKQGHVVWKLYLVSQKANVGVCPSWLVHLGSWPCAEAVMLQPQLTIAGCILGGPVSQWSQEKGQSRGNESKLPTSATKRAKRKRNGVVLAACCHLRHKEVMEIILCYSSKT